MKLGIAILGGCLLTANAFALQCMSEMRTSYGQILRTFYGQGFDDRTACMEAGKACRMELMQGQRMGQYRDADCHIVGVVTRPGPTPNPPYPNPGPNPNPGHGSYQYELDRLEPMLRSQNWRTRQAAVRELTYYPVARALGLSIEALADMDSDVQREANNSFNHLIQSIDFYRESYAIKDMGGRFLRDNRWRVRLGAVKALSKIPMIAVYELIQATADSDSDVRNFAKNTLTTLRSTGDIMRVDTYTLDQVESLYSSSSWRIRLEVIHALGSSRNPRYRTTLMRAMSDSDVDVRNAARSYLY